MREREAIITPITKEFTILLLAHAKIVSTVNDVLNYRPGTREKVPN